MADNMMMPSGTGGIVRYNEEFPSKFQLKPEHVIIFIAVIVIGMAVLKLMAKTA